MHINDVTTGKTKYSIQEKYKYYKINWIIISFQNSKENVQISGVSHMCPTNR